MLAAVDNSVVISPDKRACAKHTCFLEFHLLFVPPFFLFHTKALDAVQSLLFLARFRTPPFFYFATHTCSRTLVRNVRVV